MCVVPEDPAKRQAQEDDLAKDRLKYGSAKEDPIKYYGKKNANILKAAKEVHGKDGFLSMLKTELVDSEHLVKKGIRGIGAEKTTGSYAKFSNRKGYGLEAEHKYSPALKSIFHGLSKKENLTIKDGEGNDQHFSEHGILKHTITARVIKSIDKRIGDKFKDVDSDAVKDAHKAYEANPTNITKKAYVQALDTQIAAVKYLQERGVLTVKDDGSFRLGQFQHEGEMNVNSSNALLEAFEKNHPEVFKNANEKANNYFDYNRSIIDAKLAEGLISKDSADALKSTDYGPREFLDHTLANEIDSRSTGQSSGGGPGIRSLSKGSEDISLDHYDSRLADDTNQALRRIYENRAVREFGEHIDNYEAKAKADGFYRAKDGDPVPAGSEKLSYYDNGVKQTIIAPKSFVSAWNGIDPYLNPQAARWIRTVTGGNLFKATTTGMNPTFGLVQPIIDILHGVLASDAYPDAISGIVGLTGGFFKQLPNTFLRNGLWEEAMHSGAFQEMKSTDGSVLSRSGHKHILDYLTVNPDRLLGKVFKGISHLNETTEMSTRMGIYARERGKQMRSFERDNNRDPTAKEMTIITAKAALKAREVVDFSKGGRTMKAIGAVVPYLNAGVQATYSAARNIKENPWTTGMKYAEISGALLVGALYRKGFYEQDKDKKAAMQAEDQQIAAYAKVGYGYIPTNAAYRSIFGEDKKMFKFTLPEPIRPFNAALEQITDHMAYGTPIKWSQIMEGISQANPVNPAEMATRVPAVNAVASYEANKNFYTGGKVWKGDPRIANWQQGQYDPKVGEMYKTMGKLTQGYGDYEISPVKAQYSVGTITGNIDRNDAMALPSRIIHGALAAKEGGMPALKSYLSTNGLLDGMNHRLYATMQTNKGYDFSGMDSKTKASLNDGYETTNKVSAIYAQVKPDGTPIDKKEADIQTINLLNKSQDDGEISHEQAGKILQLGRMKGLAASTSHNFMEVSLASNEKKKAMIVYSQLKDTAPDIANAQMIQMEKLGLVKGAVFRYYYRQLKSGVKFEDLKSHKDDRSEAAYLKGAKRVEEEDGISASEITPQAAITSHHYSVSVTNN